MTGYGAAQRLWDIEQIKQLEARYFRLLDSNDWAGFAELFTSDCQHLVPTCPVQRPAGTDESAAIIGYGHYRETYRMGAEGGWRISSKRNVRLRVDRLRLKAWPRVPAPPSAEASDVQGRR